MIITGTQGERAARERAYALADSGHFHSVHGVEQALIAEGWSNAGQVMGGPHVRRAIAERCQAAEAKH